MCHGQGGSVLAGETIDKYTIVMWYGTLATIPTGWVLCDGTADTPDLRGYFVKGAAAGNAGDNTAHGNLTHLHTGETSIKTGVVSFQIGTTVAATQSHFHALETDSQNHEPPYKHLVFIMKL